MSNIISLDQFRGGRSAKGAAGAKPPGPKRIIGNGYHARSRSLFFSKDELSALLQIYSEMVARSVWRDYAIDQTKTGAIFSVFRNSHEKPLYSITRQTGPNGKGREYVLSEAGKRLKQADRLERLLTDLRMRALS